MMRRFLHTVTSGGLPVSLAVIALLVAACEQPASTDEDKAVEFERVRVQYIAALGAPDATSGDGAQDWGIWRVDPGPRGVPLDEFADLETLSGMTPAGWQFDRNDWWLEENGRIMESPEFPLPVGQYLVTGDREVTTVLTIYPDDEKGNRRWELADGATLYDVTHLGCRSARYTPEKAGTPCTPALVPEDKFRVPPGAAMPKAIGCAKQDYAVLFVVGIAT